MRATIKSTRRRNICSLGLITLSTIAGLLLAPAIATASAPPASGPQGSAPTVGAAATDRTEVHAYVPVDSSDTTKRGSVTCPEGSVAVSGGLLDDLATPQGTFRIGESVPKPTGDGWEVQIYNPQHVRGSTYVAALCDPVARDYQIVEGTPISVAPNQSKQATATCTDGRRAVSGGWRTDVPDVAGSQSLPNPSGTGWLNVVRNFGPGNATIAPLTVCARVDNYTEVTGPRTMVQPGGTARSSAWCPVGLRVVGGGYHTDTINMTAAGSSNDDGGLWSWVVTVRSDDPQPRQHYAVAVCIS